MRNKSDIWKSFAFFAVLSLYCEQMSILYAGASQLMESLFIVTGMVAIPSIVLLAGRKVEEQIQSGKKCFPLLVRGSYLFLLSSLLLLVIRTVFGLKERMNTLVSNSVIQVLLCVIVYMLLTYALRRLSVVVVLILSIAMYLLASCVPVFGSVYGLRAFFGMFIFYVIGVNSNQFRLLQDKENKKITILAYIILLVFGILAIVNPDLLTQITRGYTTQYFTYSSVGIGITLLLESIRLLCCLLLLWAMLNGPATTITIAKEMGNRALYAIVLLPMFCQVMLDDWYIGILKQITISHWRIVYTATIFIFAIAACSWTAGIFVKLLMFPLNKRNRSMKFSSVINNMTKYRFLLVELIKKGIVLKYRRSFLGILWSLIEPLLTMMVLTYVFGNFFGHNDPLYAVYVLTGRLMFTLFSSTTSQALRSIRSNSAMIKKVYVPKYMYPLSTILYNFVLFLISLIDLALVMVYYKVPITIHLLEAIIPILLLLLISVGAGMILATINVFFRDIEYLWNVFTLLLMYCSAVFYQASTLESTSAGWILKVNPVYQMIYNLRRTVMYGQALDYTSMMAASGFAVVILFVGICVFYKKQDEFILHI